MSKTLPRNRLQLLFVELSWILMSMNVKHTFFEKFLFVYLVNIIFLCPILSYLFIKLVFIDWWYLYLFFVFFLSSYQMFEYSVLLLYLWDLPSVCLWCDVAFSYVDFFCILSTYMWFLFISVLMDDAWIEETSMGLVLFFMLEALVPITLSSF